MSGPSVTWMPVRAPRGYLVNPYKQGDTMTESSDYESIQVFIGVDVGKDTHHAVAVNRSGKRLFDEVLPNDENKLRALISDLKQHGQILLVVEQPATIGALPVAVARSEGVLVGYLPGLAMRRIAELHSGEAKTDARGAATNAAVVVLPRLALQLITLRKQRDEVALEVEQRGLAPPLYPVLTSMPGVGVRTAARLLTEVACRAFASAAHLAAYAGLAPVTRRSGSSICGVHPSRRGNKRFKRPLFLSAFAALRDPIFRAYYTRKMSQGNDTTRRLSPWQDGAATFYSP